MGGSKALVIRGLVIGSLIVVIGIFYRHPIREGVKKIVNIFANEGVAQKDQNSKFL